MVEPSKKKGIISLDDIIQDEKNDGKHREFTNPNGTTYPNFCTNYHKFYIIIIIKSNKDL